MDISTKKTINHDDDYHWLDSNGFLTDDVQEEGVDFFKTSMNHYNNSFLQHPFTPTQEQAKWVPRSHTWYIDQPGHSPEKPAFNSFYGAIDVSGMPSDTMAQMVGRSGCHFKRITEMTGALYIWNNRQTNTIEVWGDYSTIQPTIQALHYHIHYITFNKKQGSDTIRSFIDDIWCTHDQWSDYNNTLFDGVYQLVMDKVIHSFTREQLSSISSKAGLSCIRFDNNNVNYFGPDGSNLLIAKDQMTDLFRNTYSKMDTTYYSNNTYIYNDDQDTKYGYHSGW